MLRRAEMAQVEFEADYVRPNSYIAREAAHKGYCEVVPAQGCPCAEYRGWEACPHHALLLHLLNTDRVTIVALTA